jgi:CheY-like chemotaxis protein
MWEFIRGNVFVVLERTDSPRRSGSPLVLIVDDDQDSREMYTVALSVTGFEPVVATTAEEAFSQACNVQPDAIFTAIMLPDGSGLDLTRRLRADSRTRGINVIVLTSHSSESTRRSARAAGCDRLLTMPCLPDALALEIDHVLARPHHLSESR